MKNYGDRGECSTEADTTQQWRGGGGGGIFERDVFERSDGLNKTSILGYLTRLLSRLLLIP